MLFLSFEALAQSDSILIKQSFDRLKDALLEENGKEAIKLVDRNTLDYYAKIFEQAKTYDSLQVEQLPILEKIEVFAIRMKAQKEDITSMDDRSFFSYAVENRMVNTVGLPIAGTELGTITMEKDSARGQLMINAMKLPFYINFYHEKGSWKVGLSSIFPISNQALKQVAMSSKKTDTEFLIEMSRMASEEKYNSIIWKPLSK